MLQKAISQKNHRILVIILTLLFVTQIEANQQAQSFEHEMILIPAGEFLMGSTNKQIRAAVISCWETNAHCQFWFESESPQHKVYLDAYYIDKYEVTIKQYKDCISKGVCELPESYVHSSRFSKKDEYSGMQNRPINWVSWKNAETYCKWVGEKLPTEAEWEKAARGTDGRTYPWGEERPDCNYAVMASKEGLGCRKDWMTWPVGSKQKDISPYGVMDMAGNLSEWVSDWYDENYYKNSPYKNPTGPINGKDKTYRGGDLASSPVAVRVARRSPLGSPASKEGYYYLGFRCASDVK